MGQDKSSVASAAFSVESASRLRDAFVRHEHRSERATLLSAALDAMCTEAHFRRMSAAEVVVAMRRAWQDVPRPAGVGTEEWATAYYASLGACLASFLETD